MIHVVYISPNSVQWNLKINNYYNHNYIVKHVNGTSSNDIIEQAEACPTTNRIRLIGPCRLQIS